MKMQKRKFRIGELAKHLVVERFVIRFWEKEFCLKTTRSGGGQRFYDENDLNLFIQIKDLLYNRGFTIQGAKQQLGRGLPSKKTNSIIPSQPLASFSGEESKTIQELKKEKELLEQRVLVLQKQLLKLRELL